MSINDSDHLVIAQRSLSFEEQLQVGEDLLATFDLGFRAEEVQIVASNHNLNADRVANFSQVSVTFSKQGADEVLILETDGGF